MITINGGMMCGALAGTGFALAGVPYEGTDDGAAAVPCPEDMCGGAPAAGASRAAKHFISIPTRGLALMNGSGSLPMSGPVSIRRGGEAGSEVARLVDSMMLPARTAGLAPLVEMVQRLADLVGNDRVLYEVVAARVLKGTRDRGREHDCRTVSLFFDSIYTHLPAMRTPFAQAFVRRAHDLFESQGNLSPNQVSAVKRMVEGRPEWAAEIVRYIREDRETLDGGRRKIAQVLKITPIKQVEVDWSGPGSDGPYSMR